MPTGGTRLITTLIAMPKLDPTNSAAMFAEIARTFARHQVQKSGGGYLIIDQRSATPLAKLRPIPHTDRFELSYWSNLKGSWKTFGNLGPMKLTLESACNIVDNDPMFLVLHRR